MNKFYFVGYLGKRVEEEHLEDIMDDREVVLISDNVDESKFKNPIQKRLFYKMHEWKRISDKEPLFASYWNRFYTLFNQEFSPEDSHYVIFWDSAISQLYSENFFATLKKKHPEVKLIFYIYDQMNRKYSKRIERMTHYCDAVFCTIPEDCDTYGFNYFPLVFPNRNISLMRELPSSDIYFMGNNSDRDEKLHSIFEYLDAKSVKCDFNIVGVSEEKQKYKGRIKYNEGFSPRENAEHTLATNCILEIMHEGMNAVTARYPEALSLKKKLLTNNKSIIHEEFYNPEYIKVYSDIEDIDCEWIKKKEKVDYGYNGEYSARELMKKVVEVLG